MPPKAAKVSVAKKSKKSQVVAVPRKQFVLDTNVLLHDPTALFRFEENDIYLPLVVLEELDRHKKGVADTARNARQVTRTLDELLQDGSMEEGFPLGFASKGIATGKLFFKGAAQKAPTEGLEEGKADNLILTCALNLLKEGHPAILVTKDINLRVKALACGIPAQNYRSDRVLRDEDVLPPGFMNVDADFWLQYQVNPNDAFWRKGGRQYTEVTLELPINSFLVESLPRNRTRLWRVERRSSTGSVLYQVHFNSGDDKTPQLLHARNEEQSIALHLLHDREVDFVAMLGPAGTGKTLLALAAGLEQVKAGKFNEIMITRATVPLGEEIGFLPGTEQEKMDAWLGGTLRDCYSVLKLEDPKNPLRMKIEIASMSFMRGRSFQGKYIIIDEAQNLTIRQMRALLTRAGDGCKVVVTGNLAQIDTPYLDEGSSGLAWAVKNLQDWQHAGHLILNRGERSRLATYVEEVAERADAAS